MMGSAITNINYPVLKGNNALNISGLGTTEVEFGVKYDENNSRTQSIRFCDDCSKKLAELLINK